MRSYGPNPPRMNYPAERSGQNRTPFFQPQDQRGPVANSGNSFPIAQMQAWNPPVATQPQDVQRGQLPTQAYGQPPHVLMKGHSS